jgi:hypothetical protein
LFTDQAPHLTQPNFARSGSQEFEVLEMVRFSDRLQRWSYQISFRNFRYFQLFTPRKWFSRLFIQADLECSLGYEINFGSLLVKFKEKAYLLE